MVGVPVDAEDTVFYIIYRCNDRRSMIKRCKRSNLTYNSTGIKITNTLRSSKMART